MHASIEPPNSAIFLSLIFLSVTLFVRIRAIRGCPFTKTFDHESHELTRMTTAWIH